MSVGENENCIRNLPRMKRWVEKMTKPLKCVCGFIKVKGFLGNILDLSSIPLCERLMCQRWH